MDEEDPTRPPPAPTLTEEAVELLRRVDAGGVPMFASLQLRRIAQENGVPVSEDMTPNAIIDALRARAQP